MRFFLFLFLILNQYSIAQTYETIDSSRYYYYLVVNPKSEYHLIKAHNFYEKRINLNLNNQTSIANINDLRMLAKTQFDLGFLYDCELTSIKALSLIQNINDNEYIKEARNGLYIQLGRVYRGLMNYQKSLEYYEIALKQAINYDDSLSIFNNKANIYLEQNNYQLAINEFQKVYEGRIKLNNLLKTARALDNLGFSQSKLDLYEGFSNMMNALKIRTKLDDKKGLFSSYRHLAYYNIDKGNNIEALKNVDKCYEIANTINSVSFKKEALSLYVDLNQDKKIIEYKTLSDSIENAKQLRENKFASMKYDKEKEILKTNESNLQREKEKRLKLIYQSIALFSTLIFIASLIIFRIKNRKDKLEQIIKTESRISTKIHDEVANDIYQVMIKLEEHPEDHDAILEEIDEIYNKTRDISKENASVEVQEDYEMVLKDLLKSYQNNNNSIFTKNITSINWNKVSIIRKTTIYRVLQELMTNMKKHSSATHVVLNFKSNKKKIVIEYKDNGVGCELKKKSGLQNMENRIESIGGTINFDSKLGKGFKTTITI
jgi:signal transduction histidine kinase